MTKEEYSDALEKILLETIEHITELTCEPEIPFEAMSVILSGLTRLRDTFADFLRTSELLNFFERPKDL